MSNGNKQSPREKKKEALSRRLEGSKSKHWKEKGTMVATKGKTNMGFNRVFEDAQHHRTARSRHFKIYSDDEKAKIDASIKIPVPLPVNKENILASTIAPKVISKTLGKLKGNNDSSGTSVNQNFRRKALADLSNVYSSFSRNAARDSSKPMTVSGPGSKTTGLSSRKFSVGKIRTNLSQNVGDQQIMRKGATTDLKVSSNDLRTNRKSSACASTALNKRMSASNSIAAMRKSLPVLKKVNTAHTSNMKEIDESSVKAKRTSRIPVKVKFSKKVVPQTNISRNHLWRNRVSDGFITMVSKDQTNAGAHVSSRKTVRTMVRTAVTASNVHRASRNKPMSTVNNLTQVIASSKKKVEPLPRSHSENAPVVISHEPIQEHPPSNNSIEPIKNNLADISRRKSDRRRSFTSLLMAGSKLVEGHGDSTKQDKLPSIDDTLNQLEVAEYVDEIYQYYWVLEVHNLPMVNYLSIQPDITPRMRGIVINWLIEVHFKFELMQETLYLMVTLLDRYLSQVRIKKNEMQLVALTALLLASKYEDFWHPRIKDLISVSAEAYTRNQMLLMERLFLKTLKFRLNEPTPYVFMLRFLKAAQSDTKLEHLAFYLIELSLVEYEALKFKPSMLCASAIYVARSTLNMTPSWTPLLAKHARYEASQIMNCAEMILRFHKAARTAQMKVTYEKYMRADLSGVAAITPLDKLPL